MSNVWLRAKVWTKVAAFAAVLVYLTLFVINNSENAANLWYWFGQGRQVQTSVLKLIAIAFLLGLLVAVLTGTTFRTIKQIGELRDRQRAERTERDARAMREKAAMLQTRSKGTSAPKPADAGPEA